MHVHIAELGARAVSATHDDIVLDFDQDPPTPEWVKADFTGRAQGRHGTQIALERVPNYGSRIELPTPT